MQFFTLIVSALSIASAAFAVPAELAERTSTVKVTYDRTYDNKDASLDIVACSNGKNGLEHLGFTTIGSLPNFPYVGGAHVVEGWNSTNCGSCWQLTYKDQSINVLAIDTAGVGFNIALEALDKLTGGQGEQLGFVQANVEGLPRSACGL